MTKSLNERINEALQGGCYRFIGDPEEKVFHSGYLSFDEFGKPRIKVWYPVLDQSDYIPLDIKIEDIEVINVTEIDKIRARYEQRRTDILAHAQTPTKCTDSEDDRDFPGARESENSPGLGGCRLQDDEPFPYTFDGENL